MSSRSDMKNGFEEHKRDILNKLDTLQKGHNLQAEKFEDFRLFVVKSFGKMETSIAVIKTKVAFIGIAAGGLMSIAINIGIKVFS